MSKTRWKQMIYSVVLSVLLLLSGSMAVYAENSARMALTFDSSSYEAGSIVTAQIYIYDAEFNAAGFSLEYNTDRMIPVRSDGTDSDNGNQLITIHNQYDDEEGTGAFSVLSRDVNKEKGKAEALFYINPNAGRTLTADSGGMLIGEISFRMLEVGAPDVKFAVNEESVDFYAVPCLILNEGTQIETAYADVQAGEQTLQNVDVSKEVIDQTDAGLESRENEETSSNTAASDGQNENAGTQSDGSSDYSSDAANSDEIVKNREEKDGLSNNETNTEKNSEFRNTGDEKNNNSKGNNDSQSGQWSAVYTVAVVLVILIAAGIIVIILKNKEKEEKDDKKNK